MKKRFKQETGAVRCPLEKSAGCRIERGAEGETLVVGDWPGGCLTCWGCWRGAVTERGRREGGRLRTLCQFLTPGTEKVAEHRESGIGGGPSFLLGYVELERPVGGCWGHVLGQSVWD